MDIVTTMTTEVTGTPHRRPLTHPEEAAAMLAEYPVAVICDCTGVLEEATPMVRDTVMDAPGATPLGRFLGGCHEVFRCSRCGGHELFPPAGGAGFVRESWPEWGSRRRDPWTDLSDSVSKTKIRNVDVETSVDVECCEHCHGDPADCPDTRQEVDPVAAVADAASTALDLLEQVYIFVASNEELPLWRQLCLRDDLRQFLARCGAPVVVAP